MPEMPTFGRFVEIAYDRMTPDQQEGYRSLMKTRGVVMPDDASMCRRRSLNSTSRFQYVRAYYARIGHTRRSALSTLITRFWPHAVGPSEHAACQITAVDQLRHATG